MGVCHENFKLTHLLFLWANLGICLCYVSLLHQVVYSSAARELKMETTKPEKADKKEEEDIDIDAI